jgi:hypothetical protein
MTRILLEQIFDRYGNRSVSIYEIVDDTGRYLELNMSDQDDGFIDLDSFGAGQLLAVLSGWVQWV